MWALILIPSLPSLPWWLSLPCSALVLISLLSSLIVAMQNFLIANRRLQDKRQKLIEDSVALSSVTNENSNFSKAKELSPVITMRRTAVLMLIGICSIVILVRWAKTQRGYCTSTGDISFSDGMTVATDFRG